MDMAGAHLAGRWEAGAAWLPLPSPWSIIYLQQNAGKHPAGKSTREKSVWGHCSGEGGWILQFSRFYSAAINRAGEIKVAVQIQIR